MLTAEIIISIVVYIAMGAWTFGYTTGIDGAKNDRGLSFYIDESAAWSVAIMWPITLVCIFLLAPITKAGFRGGNKSHQIQKLRVELETKIRVEQEKAMKELDVELEKRFQSLDETEAVVAKESYNRVSWAGPG